MGTLIVTPDTLLYITLHQTLRLQHRRHVFY